MTDHSVKEAFDLARDYVVRPDAVEITDGEITREVLVLPTGDGGFEVKSTKELLAEYQTEPERRKGTAKLTELVSFIEHVNRFSDEDSAIFADRTSSKPALLCVFDYHRAGQDGSPRFGEHRARYEFPLADEWLAWKSKNNQVFQQAEFAAWLEDHLTDVMDPSGGGTTAGHFAETFGCTFAGPSKLLTLSKGLSIHVGRKVVNHANLSTGESVMTFAEEHTDAAGKQVTIANAFLLGLPVFRGGDRYQIPVRLRYRLQGSQVTWSYTLHRDETVFDLAVSTACQKAAAETKLPLFMGTPQESK